MTAPRTSARTPRRRALDRDVAMTLAATEYDRVSSLLARLTPDQWRASTDCPGWDVRAMAGHVLGMAQMAASLPEMVRQQLGAQRRVKREGALPIDALTALQVERNSALTVDELVAELRRVGPRAARARRRTPRLVRDRTVPEKQVFGGQEEWWTFEYLLDVILTRDPFMHRIDITRATGVPMELTADHEGVLVDDVVREWAGRHDDPFALELTGPAGGHWERGHAEPVRMDALELCRVLSGRAPGSGPLSVQVPF